GALCYWRKNPKYVSGAIQAWPPADDFEMSWNIMMRTLQGQGPKVQSILTKPIPWTYDDVSKALGQDCSESSDKWTTVGVGNWGGTTYLDQFFLRPADPEKYKP